MATTPNVKSVPSILAHRKFLLGAMSALAVGIVAGVGAKLLAGGSAGAFNAGAINTGDTAWVLAAAALVMIMTPADGRPCQFRFCRAGGGHCRRKADRFQEGRSNGGE
jgi:hypothetical protein